MALYQFYQRVHRMALLKEYETKLFSTYNDLKAVFIERFNRTLLHINNKLTFINGDGNWADILNDSVVTYNNNTHSTTIKTPVDAFDNPDKVKYTFNFKNNKPNLKVGYYVKNADERNFFSKRYSSYWNRELFKVIEVLKSQPPTYKIEDMNGERIEGKYYEQ